MPVIPMGSGGLHVECTACAGRFRKDALDYRPDLLVDYRSPDDERWKGLDSEHRPEPVPVPSIPAETFRFEIDSERVARMRARTGAMRVAVASLVLGGAAVFALQYSGWFVLPLAAPAVIVGHLARQKAGEAEDGRTASGYALLGLLVGYGSLLSVVVRETDVIKPLLEARRVVNARPQQPIRPVAEPARGPDPADNHPTAEDAESMLADLMLRNDRSSAAIDRLARAEEAIGPREEIASALVDIALAEHVLEPDRVWKALAVWGTDTSAKKLLSSLSPNEETESRRRKLEVAYSIGGSRVVESMVAASYDRDTLKFVAELLQLSPGMSDAEKGIIGALRSQNPMTRVAACDLLAQCGTERSIEALRQLSADPEESVRERARWAAGVVAANHGK